MNIVTNLKVMEWGTTAVFSHYFFYPYRVWYLPEDT